MDENQDALFDKNRMGGKRAVGADETGDYGYPLSAAQSKNQNDQLVLWRFRRFGEIYVSDMTEDMESRFYLRISQARHYIRCFRCAGNDRRNQQVISGRLEA